MKTRTSGNYSKPSAGSFKTRTIEVIKTAEHYLSGHPAVENVMTVDGFNMFSSTSSASAGAIWIKLKHLKDRGDVKKIDDIIGQFGKACRRQAC